MSGRIMRPRTKHQEGKEMIDDNKRCYAIDFANVEKGISIEFYCNTINEILAALRQHGLIEGTDEAAKGQIYNMISGLESSGVSVMPKQHHDPMQYMVDRLNKIK